MTRPGVERGLNGLVLAFALVFVALSLSPGYVAGTGPYWQLPAHDVAQGQIGWYYYARDGWHAAPLRIDNYHAPEGGHLLLSDSLPLLAIPAKLIYQLAWPADAIPPVYLGWWVAACLLAQVLAASALLRALDVRAVAPHLAGVALLSFMPMLFLRFGHATLMAQALILFALTGYVLGKRDALTRRAWWALCALPVVALWITPYLAAMTGLIVAVTIVDGWRDGRLSAGATAARLGGLISAGIVLVGLSGLFGQNARNLGDYGLYSLNLLSPFVPFPETLLGRWFETNIASPAHLHQWEGGSYLGAGLLFLCVAALPALRHWRAGLHRHAVLVAALSGSVLFAISHRVSAGSTELLTVPLPQGLVDLLSTLRGSGRFVWIAVHTLAAAAIVAVARLYRAGTAAALLVTAALLQVIDVAPLQARVHERSSSAAPLRIDPEAWTGLIAAHDRLFQFPSFECDGLFGRGVPGDRWRELQIDWIAARLNRPTNSAYLARPTKDCAREREAALSGRREPGTLYLFRASEDIGRLLAEHGERSTGCGYLDDVVVCSADHDLSQLDQSVLPP